VTKQLICSKVLSGRRRNTSNWSVCV